MREAASCLARFSELEGGASTLTNVQDFAFKRLAMMAVVYVFLLKNLHNF